MTQYATLIYLIKRFFGNSRGFLTSWELIVAILYNFLFFYLFLFKRDWGMGVTFFEIAHLVPVFFTTNNKSKFFYAKIVLAVLLSFFFWTRADIIIRGLSLLTVIGLNVVIFQEARSGELVSGSYLINLFFIWIEKTVHYTKSLFKFLLSWQTRLERFKKVTKSETIKKILVGALFSVPILFVLIGLFSSADQNFQNIFSEFYKNFKFLFNLEWLKNINWIWDFVFQFGLFWIYLCLVFPWTDTKNHGELVLTKQIVEKITIGVLVSGVFAIFIVTQFKSVSFILNGFTTGQINPGAYVREGFFQLLIASLIGLSVFYILKKELSKSFLTLFLLTEIFLVSLVAGERVWLYQYQFGLTQIRVWGIFFLLFLFKVIFTLLLNLKSKVNDNTTWQIYIVAFSTLIFCAGLINIDHLIATVRPPVVDGKIDVTYMANNLSWDAADLWINELKDTKTGNLEYKYNLVTNLGLYIANLENHGSTYTLNISEICNKKSTDWLSENISVSRNKKVICENYEIWMNFKRDYENTHGIPNGSCKILDKKLTIGSDGRSWINCNIQVINLPYLSNVYCENQQRHVKQTLTPYMYQNGNNGFYGTIDVLNSNDEVKVFVHTETGSNIECLPS